MSLPTITLLFDRERKTNKGKPTGLLQFQVYCPNTCKRKYFAVCQISPQNWDAKGGTAKGLGIYEIAQINEVRTKLQDVILSLNLEGKFTLDGLVSAYNGNARVFVSDYWNTSIDTAFKNNEIVQGTRDNLKGIVTLLNSFKKNVSFVDIDAAFVASFTKYLQSTRKPSTVNNILGQFRSVYNSAKAKGLFKSDISPFPVVRSLPQGENIKFLELEQVVEIEGLTFVNQKHEQIRDMYLFACFTGLRWSDVSALTDDNFQKEKDGSIWLVVKMQKTQRHGKELRFCLSGFWDEKALVLYRKYSKGFGLLFPLIGKHPKSASNTVNAVVKRFTNGLGFHSSRHTYAMLLYNDNNLSLTTVSYLLGHSSTKTTQIYAKLRKDRIMNFTRGLGFGRTAATGTTTAANTPTTAPSA